MIHPSKSCSWIIMLKWNLVSRVSICFDNFLGCTSPELMKPQNWLFWALGAPGKKWVKRFWMEFFILLILQNLWCFLLLKLCCFFGLFGGVLEIDNQPSEWFKVASSSWFLRYTGRNLFLVKENEKTPEVFQFWFLFVLQRVSRMLVGSLFGHRVSSSCLLFMQSFPVGETKNQSL